MTSGLPAFRPPAADGLFPLALTPLELIFLSSEEPQYPMQFQIRGALTGELQREPWERACAAAFRRHPLLAATIRRNAEGAWCWEAAAESTVAIHWSTPASAAHAWPPIDLQRQPGVRMFIQARGQASDVVLQVHHACCDAAGALQFLADLCELYAADRERRCPELPNVQPLRLQHRHFCGVSRLEWCLRAPQDGLALLGLYEYWFHRPVPLGTDIATDAAVGAPPLSVTLSEPMTRALRNFARTARVTLNDLLVTTWFETLHASLQAAGRADADAWLRIVIPVNLRRSSDRSLPAANRVSLIYLDRRPLCFRTPQALLRSVHRELWWCKLWKAGLSFLRILLWRQRLCGVWRSHGFRERCLATAILSNLGETWERLTQEEGSGGRRLPGVSRLEFAPPLAPLVSAALGVSTVQGRMTITLNYDDRRLTMVEAEALLHGYERRLLEWLTIPPHRDRSLRSE